MEESQFNSEEKSSNTNYGQMSRVGISRNHDEPSTSRKLHNKNEEEFHSSTEDIRYLNYIHK